MLEMEAFAIAARLYVGIRQKLGRITDVQWMLKNSEYADEVIQIARAQIGSELADLANKFEAVLAARRTGSKPSVLPSRSPNSALNPEGEPEHEETAPRYVGRLR